MVVSAILVGNSSISSHVNGIWVYFHIIKTQKKTVNNVVTKNHHSVKYANGENHVRWFNCQQSKYNKVQIATLNKTNSANKYRENQSNIIKIIVSNRNIKNNDNDT